MKTKVISFLMFVGLLFVFPSCEGPMGPMGPEGLPGNNSWEVFDMSLDGEHWQWDKDREMFYYVFEDKALTKNVVEGGVVQVAIDDFDAYLPLPYSRNIYDNGAYLTERVEYEYGVGWIRFNFTATDLFDNVIDSYKPATLIFKVTLLW